MKSVNHRRVRRAIHHTTSSDTPMQMNDEIREPNALNTPERSGDGFVRASILFLWSQKKSSVEGGECTQSVLDQILADELL